MLDHDFDVIVAGGGPAGIGAAVAAVRSGARTLMVERAPFAGGMWTAGTMLAFLIMPIKAALSQNCASGWRRTVRGRSIRTRTQLGSLRLKR